MPAQFRAFVGIPLYMATKQTSGKIVKSQGRKAVAAAAQKQRRAGNSRQSGETSAPHKSAKRKSANLKDPEGGLTAAGRAAYRRKEGAHLKPGVSGPADTPEKQKRKGSFLRRHFAQPRGPMVKDGKPTRLALSAHAWGEPVPKTMAAAKKLAAKGAKLLVQYQKSKTKTGPEKTGPGKKRATKGASTRASASANTRRTSEA